MRAYTHIDHFDDHRPFYPWLASIAVRLAQNWLRQHGRTVRREGTALDRSPSQARGGRVDDADHGSAQSAPVAGGGGAVLGRANRRRALLPRRDGGARHCRRARRQTGTIKTLLFRARRHLRGRLGRDGSTGDIEMTCAHVLGLIDAGSFAGLSAAHLDAAWQHARQCATCGPAHACRHCDRDRPGSLAATRAAGASRAAVMARIARIETRDPSRAAEQAGAAWFQCVTARRT